MNPLISVIINCYNGEHFLRETIDSVISQTYQHWELIFWDNQSSDLTAEIVKEYADSRIFYYYAPSHTSLGVARNCALSASKGDYIAFLDADDVWSPLFIERCINVFKNNGDLGIVYSRFTNFENSREWLSAGNKIDGIIPLARLISIYNIAMSGAVVKRTVIEKSQNMFDGRFSLIEDFDFFICNGAYCDVYYISESLLRYRWHNSNYSKTKQNLWFKEFDMFYEKAKHLDILNDYLPTIRKKWEDYKVRDLLINKEKGAAVKLIMRRSLWNPSVLRYLYPVIFGMNSFHKLRTILR